MKKTGKVNSPGERKEKSHLAAINSAAQTAAAELLSQSGRLLLRNGLTARTWGNLSCRLDDEFCAITPSGLDYNTMRPEQIVRLNIRTGDWSGSFPPSGEKAIHMAAYEMFKDVGFVIHTHQDCATAISLAGFDTLDITERERSAFGGLGLAKYGIPGTKRLGENVKEVLKSGCQTVLMAHHGALVCGSSREEAMDRAMLLEKICARNIRMPDMHSNKRDIDSKAFDKPIKKRIGENSELMSIQTQQAEELGEKLSHIYEYSEVFTGGAVSVCAEAGNPIYAQTDDMAQMIGKVIPAASLDEAALALKKYNAVIIRGVGAAVRGNDRDDTTALRLLTAKACLCFAHTAAHGKKARLGAADVAYMNYIYRHKYSKRKSQAGTQR